MDEKQTQVTEQSRWKSPVFLAAFAAQILSILVFLGALDVGQSEAVSGLVGALLQCFVLFGVLNDPTSKDRF